MKTDFERTFIRAGRRGQALLQDELISLVPREYGGHVAQLGGAKSLVFDIIMPGLSPRPAGEIALRVGEDESLFYLGHIGYHVDPPFRGHSAALHACRLCIPVLAELGMRTFVITTDEDNLPSILTCERLGCVLESTVDVPLWCRQEFSISACKRRYVYDPTLAKRR
ncbi:MAG: hypothetical protein SOV75_12085 [Candidatus Limiplasma sp.]|nr:hypothetical protein [Candidatus Limiplasma sp.]